MPSINEGAYRISGRFGEAYFTDPTGKRAPRRIMEVTQVEATLEIGVEDVMLPGNKTGTKDGGESMTGTMAIQQIDSFWDQMILEARSGNLEARRKARDAGQRIQRTFTLQIWQDDPEALGAIGWQLEGVRISTMTVGFNFADIVTGREYPFRYEEIRPIQGFERIGNQIDPITGLPAISQIAIPNGPASARNP